MLEPNADAAVTGDKSPLRLSTVVTAGVILGTSYLHMSRFARRFHLASAIVASVTCILWSVLTVLVTFRWHTVRPRLALAAIPVVIGVGAIMAFKFYKSENGTD